LLVFDEVQCGLGRSGSLFAYEQTPVVPDVMTLAKALGGGLPIGAMLAAEHCAGALQPGYHGSTFGGNPVACAAALVAFELLADPVLQASANDLGDRLTVHLAQYGKVQGRGLMLGVELEEEIDAKQIVAGLLIEHRVIANATSGSTLRFLPPLTATDEDADRATAALDDVWTSLNY
ncbi:MAG: aspartate aminotransferase family protein, partial [Solirubrobacterales bacterium]